MMNSIKAVAILAAVAQARVLGRQGTAGTSTRYWDCCKASCSWNKGYALSSPVTTCDIHDQPLSDGGNAHSVCEDPQGPAFTCSTQQPFAINSTLAYGFAAVTGSTDESETCCGCYKLTFTSEAVAGQQMIVQATNIGYDVSQTQFDLALPGGGVGAFPQGCQTQYNAGPKGWGDNAYGGVSSRDQCATLPSQLQPGCDFRFDWLKGANNPTVNYERVPCPAELVAKSNCRRNDDPDNTTTPPSDPGNGSTVPLYGQCGGQGWTGGTICASGSTCQEQSQYYSQCLPPSGSGTTNPPPSQPSSGTSPTTTQYGQCGGDGWTGPTQCPSGMTCQVQNEYYSQCL